MKTAQMIILACSGTAPRQAIGKKRGLDVADSLPSLAVQCAAALFGLCHNSADLADVLALLPVSNGSEFAGQLLW